jgi:hypothetical protein
MSDKEVKKPKKPGRKKIIVDPVTVEQLAAQGLGTVQIARAMGISWDTLDRNKRQKAEIADAIKKGKAKGLAKVTNSLFKSANSGNVTAQIFYLKNQDADTWSDRQEVNHNLNIKELLESANQRIIDAEVIEPGETEPGLTKEMLTKNGG